MDLVRVRKNLQKLFNMRYFCSLMTSVVVFLLLRDARYNTVPCIRGKNKNATTYLRLFHVAMPLRKVLSGGFYHCYMCTLVIIKREMLTSRKTLNTPLAIHNLTSKTFLFQRYNNKNAYGGKGFT